MSVSRSRVVRSLDRGRNSYSVIVVCAYEDGGTLNYLAGQFGLFVVSSGQNRFERDYIVEHRLCI